MTNKEKEATFKAIMKACLGKWYNRFTYCFETPVGRQDICNLHMLVHNHYNDPDPWNMSVNIRDDIVGIMWSCGSEKVSVVRDFMAKFQDADVLTDSQEWYDASGFTCVYNLADPNLAKQSEYSIGLILGVLDDRGQ